MSSSHGGSSPFGKCILVLLPTDVVANLTTFENAVFVLCINVLTSSETAVRRETDCF